MRKKQQFSFARKWLMIGAICFSIPIAAYSQQQKVSANIHNRTLKEAIQLLSKQTSMNVAYSKEFVDTDKNVNLKVKNVTLEEALNLLLKNTNIGFRFLDNSILLFNKNEQKSPVKTEKKEISIHGKVVDKATGEPIIGSTVGVAGMSACTITDVNGDYSLKVAEGSTLLFSFIGYTEARHVVNRSGSLDIALTENTVQLNDVVVVGYGVQKKVNLTGAVAAVKGSELENRPITNATSGLQGLLPGVTITNNSGQPGANSTSIIVRGISTINSNTSPLILIDGVAGGDINLINPDDIESVSVLKDAASSSIYGARAANGVILITTKQGAKKDKTTVSYSGYVGFQSPTSLPELVNGREYMDLENEARLAAGFGKVYQEDAYNDYDNGTDPNNYSNTNWIDAIYKKRALQTNHNISVKGGTEKASYFMSYGYLDQEGLIVGDGYNSKRHNARINVDTEAFNRLKLNANVSFVDYYRNDCGGSGTSGVFRLAQRISPLIPIYWKKQADDGTWVDSDVFSSASVKNPVDVAYNSGYSKRNSRTLNGIMNASLKIIEGLNISGQYAANYYVRDINSWSPKMPKYFSDFTEDPGNINLKNQVSKSYFNTLTQTLNAQINYDASLGKHHFKTLAGFSQEWSYTNTLSASRKQVLLDGVEVIDGGTEDIINGGTAYDWALRSYFGRINYDFAEKYLFEANIRADGTSRFAPENRWGYFPSFSAGWRFTEEEFMKFVKPVMDSGKIRVSWGELGNQNISDDYYPYLTAIEQVDKAYPIGNQSNVGYKQTFFGNSKIKWETIRMFNVGVDFTFFGNRLNATFDWYKKENIDALVRPIYPSLIGIASTSHLPLENIGAIENKGWELSLAWRDRVGDITYSAMFNIFDSRNKITDLGNSAPILENNLRRVGSPINAYYGYLTDGLVQISDFEGQNEQGKYINPKFAMMSAYTNIIQPGDVKYRDISGKDGVPDGIIDNYDKVEFGDPYPRYNYSFKGDIGWKGFDLSFYLQGVGKVSGYLTEEARHCFINDYSVPKKSHLDRWTPNNPGASYPRMYYAQTHNMEFSDYWLEDASYLRLKNLQVGYSFPKSMLKKMQISKLRAYISMDNLFTITNYFSGFDPEVRETAGDAYPQVKTYVLGLNVTF
ncbi:TonB-dependent receptor [Bacteroides sedimenti]